MRLKKYLEQEKISIRHFAKMLSISHVGVFNIVHGLTEPRIGLAYQIMNATKGSVLLWELLKLEDDEKDKKKDKDKNNDKAKAKKKT